MQVLALLGNIWGFIHSVFESNYWTDACEMSVA